MTSRNKSRLASLALLLAAFASSSTNAYEPSPSQIAQLKRAVVLITTYDDRGNSLLQGSGFFIGSEQVVTNLHVIKGASQIRIETFAGTTTTVRSVVATNRRTDLALLQVAQSCPDSATLPMSTAPPVEGEAIVLVSNPQGSRWKVTAGHVGLLWKLAGRGTRLQISAAILPGSSGGPVVNERGQVIGIASSHTNSADDLNFAVPIQNLRSLQAQARFPSRSPTRGPRAGSPRGVGRSERAPLNFAVTQKEKPSLMVGLLLGKTWKSRIRVNPLAYFE